MQISIIIPVYNGERFIQRAIRSIVDQNFPRKQFEIIVVDDGSTDNTSDIIQPFKDTIGIMRHEKNMGLAASRNTGIKAARGQYIVNLDADDYLHQDFLYIETMFLSLNADFDAVSCDYYIVDEHEKHLERKNATEYPIACGIMFRMEQLIDIGLYSEDFLAREEEDLRQRFLKKYRIHHIPLPLYRYRKHDDNITNNQELMKEYKKKFHEKHF
jgi:glycosyltransferase involved in cell wall biosynthesis